MLVHGDFGRKLTRFSSGYRSSAARILLNSDVDSVCACQGYCIWLTVTAPFMPCDNDVCYEVCTHSILCANAADISFEVNSNCSIIILVSYTVSGRGI